MDRILGCNKLPEIKKKIKNGAVIIDVRTEMEFEYGHAKNSRNFPLDGLEKNVNQIKKIGKPIVVCCASGMRSAKAKKILESYGITDVYDGKSWMNLNHE